MTFDAGRVHGQVFLSGWIFVEHGVVVLAVRRAIVAMVVDDERPWLGAVGIILTWHIDRIGPIEITGIDIVRAGVVVEPRLMRFAAPCKLP